jgi:hypothetical protein
VTPKKGAKTPTKKNGDVTEMNIKDRITAFKRVKASTLTPHPLNWRKHPQKQRDAMAGVLQEVGYVDAIMVRKHEDGYQIIDGHLRAETTPDTKVPVLVVDLDDKETAKVLTTFDPIASLATQESEMLAALLKSQEGDDALARLVWPDYVIDPLLTVDWTPPDVEDMNVYVGPNHQVIFTPDQWKIVKQACMKARDGEDGMKEGRCIELICADFLAGH